MASELCFAAGQGNLAHVQKLLDTGRPVDERDGSQQTPLHHAARGGHLEIVNELLARGADASARSANGKLPLHQAAGSGALYVVRKLLAVASVDIDALTRDERRWSALHFAVFGNHADVIQLLFELGANVDILGARDWTPLHQAAFLGHGACVSALLAAGANPQRLNAGGHLPYKLAKQQKHTSCYKLLKNATKATPVREKSPRKLVGAMTVAHGLGAAPAAAESARATLAVPDGANSARARPRVAQSSPNLIRNAERTWTCPSCEYAHNTTPICAVCATSRPGAAAASSPPRAGVTRVPSPRAPLPVVPAASSPPRAGMTRVPSPRAPLPAATSSPAPAAAANHSPRPRRLDSAIQEVLGRLELASYADTFVENEIDHAALLLLSENDLKDLGITALGPRRKLLAYIQDPKFQPYKPGYHTSESLAPPTLPGTMVPPMVPRGDLFRSSGGGAYERAPPPKGEYGHVLVTPSGASPYGELPALGHAAPPVSSGYKPIAQAQAEVPENDSDDDSGNRSDGDGVYAFLPDVRSK